MPQVRATPPGASVGSFVSSISPRRLWESLTDAERNGEFELSDTDRAELDRRWTEHLDDPDSAVPWSEVRTKLLD